jgi:hypothetical protein
MNGNILSGTPINQVIAQENNIMPESRKTMSNTLK